MAAAVICEAIGNERPPLLLWRGVWKGHGGSLGPPWERAGCAALSRLVNAEAASPVLERPRGAKKESWGSCVGRQLTTLPAL